MRSKKKLLESSVLYAIIDKAALGKRPWSSIRKTFTHVDMVQLRDKCSSRKTVLEEAFVLSRLLRKRKCLYIINDYIDIARIVDSDGVHLGQDDIPLAYARRLLGKDKIIGISCHSLSQALTAQAQGADYIGVGPVFSTPTKPEYPAVGLQLIRECSRKIHIPFFAIGSIDLKNIAAVRQAGAQRIAVARAVPSAERLKSILLS